MCECVSVSARSTAANMGEYERIYANMREYARICANMCEYVKNKTNKKRGPTGCRTVVS